MIIEEQEKEIKRLTAENNLLRATNHLMWREIEKIRSGIRQDMFVLRDGNLK